MNNGSSRLLVQVAHAIEAFGEKNFEVHLNQLLISKNTIPHKKPADERAQAIIRIIASDLSVSQQEIKKAAGEDGRFALNTCYYFFVNKLKWDHRKIAGYFNRRNHRSVSYGLNMINCLDSKNKFDAPKLEKINLIEIKINKELKKNGYGTKQGKT